MQKPPIFRKYEDKGTAVECEITRTRSLRRPFSNAAFLKQRSNSVVPAQSLLPPNLRGLICLV